VHGLGTFTPSTLEAGTIHVELDRWLRDFGVTGSRLQPRGKLLPIGVRGPAEHLKLCQDPVISKWHRDGLTDPFDRESIPGTHWMIVWSNGAASELRGRGSHWIFEPGAVILVDNFRVWHRAPPREEGRWFARLLDPEFSSSVE
jgi:hypothetical protein